MNKLIIAGAAALMLAAASCSKNSGSAADESTLSKATVDSISDYYGLTRGGYVLADYMNFSEEHQNEATKADILKGIRLVLGSVESDGMMIGVQVGVTMLQELEQLKEQGVTVDRSAVLKYFKQVFDADSLDMDAFREYNSTYNSLIAGVQQAAENRRLAEAAEAPEAKQNSIAGKAFLDKIKSNDPEAKSTPSGSVVQVLQPGQGDNITENSVVEINYVGKFIDGTVFDESEEGQPATFSPKSVIPGLSEALLTMNKGTHAIVYIPGEAAYGVDGVPQAGIGPNQTLVFDIEIVDVK